MSGDTQPRKRKDKKRKKDDSIEQVPPQLSTPSSTLSDDINIHVHKEDGTGGGICAKIVFFLLFSALAVLIGLIITEHRGLTDLDAVDSESRFSQIFEGWTDTSSHADHEHDDDQHIVDSLEDHDDDDDIHENEIEEEHEEDDEEEESLEHSEDSNEEDRTIESEDILEDEDDNDEEASHENSEDVDDEDKSAEQDQDDEDDDMVDDDDEDDNDEDNKSDIDNESEEQVQSKEHDDDDNDDQDEKDDNEDKVEEGDHDEPEADEGDKEAVDDDQNNSRMVIKIGVGVALLVVAHVVLVRKWKSASPSTPPPQSSSTDEEPFPDLSRRNTIVVPPAYQEIEQDIEEDVDEDYSDDDDDELESDEERPHLKSAKLKYQELRTTYTRSLTPEVEGAERKASTSSNNEDEDEDEEVGSDEEDDEEEESEIEDIEKEDEDEDLLKRLESKYGKLKDNKEEDPDEQESSWIMDVGQDYEAKLSGSETDEEAYEYENITNKHDQQIRKEIDEAEENIKNNAAYALKLFDVLLQKYPSSPRTLYGKAQCLDILADQKRSNDLLQKAIGLYLQVLTVDDVPDVLFEKAAERCINRTRFIGFYNKAIDVHKRLVARFPKSPKYRNQLAVTYLTTNRISEARSVLLDTLKQYPDDGFALVHYGFILKTADNKLNQSVGYLKKGIGTRDAGVMDGRFYFHLGDALARLGRVEEAMKIYEEGVQFGLFLSKYQRSLYNVDRLKGQPWWKKQETPYQNLYRALENNWQQIRAEGLSVLQKNGLFQHESENLKDTGDWKQFELFSRGKKNVENCKKCPITCKIIDSIPDARGCRRGQTKFSVMHPGTHVWPHCGPTNCRLRVHLGLKVPDKTYIRVADEIRSWKNGEAFVFDDSFEHEVWHNGTTLRLVLIVDVWHPELTLEEKRSLSSI